MQDATRQHKQVENHVRIPDLFPEAVKNRADGIDNAAEQQNETRAKFPGKNTQQVGVHGQSGPSDGDVQDHLDDLEFLKPCHCQHNPEDRARPCDDQQRPAGAGIFGRRAMSI